MEENKNITMTRSIRADEATLDRFKKMSEQFDNQGKALQALLDAYELDSARAAIPGSADMLDALQGHLSGIQNAFVFALELKQNAEAAAKESVQKTIDTKDKIISENYEKIEALKAENEALRSEAKESKEQLSEALKGAKNASEALEATKSSLIDKTELLSSKNAEIERLSSENVFIPAMKKEIDNLKAENSSLQKEKETTERNLQAAKEAAERTISDLKKESDRISADHEKTLQTIKKEAETAAVIAKQTADNEKKSAVLETKEFYIAKIEAKDNEIRDLERQVAELQKALSAAKQKPAPASTATAPIEQMTIEETDLF